MANLLEQGIQAMREGKDPNKIMERFNEYVISKADQAIKNGKDETKVRAHTQTLINDFSTKLSEAKATEPQTGAEYLGRTTTAGIAGLGQGTKEFGVNVAMAASDLAGLVDDNAPQRTQAIREWNERQKQQIEESPFKQMNPAAYKLGEGVGKINAEMLAMMSGGIPASAVGKIGAGAARAGALGFIQDPGTDGGLTERGIAAGLYGTAGGALSTPLAAVGSVGQKATQYGIEKAQMAGAKLGLPALQNLEKAAVTAPFSGMRKIAAKGAKQLNKAIDDVKAAITDVSGTIGIDGSQAWKWLARNIGNKPLQGADKRVQNVAKLADEISPGMGKQITTKYLARKGTNDSISFNKMQGFLDDISEQAFTASHGVIDKQKNASARKAGQYIKTYLEKEANRLGFGKEHKLAKTMYQEQKAHEYFIKKIEETAYTKANQSLNVLDETGQPLRLLDHRSVISALQKTYRQMERGELRIDGLAKQRVTDTVNGYSKLVKSMPAAADYGSGQASGAAAKALGTLRAGGGLGGMGAGAYVLGVDPTTALALVGTAAGAARLMMSPKTASMLRKLGQSSISKDEGQKLIQSIMATAVTNAGDTIADEDE